MVDDDRSTELQARPPSARDGRDQADPEAWSSALLTLATRLGNGEVPVPERRRSAWWVAAGTLAAAVLIAGLIVVLAAGGGGGDDGSEAGAPSTVGTTAGTTAPDTTAPKATAPPATTAPKPTTAPATTAGTRGRAPVAALTATGLQAVDVGIAYGAEGTGVPDDARADLLELIVYLQRHPAVDAEVIGHTDSEGSEQFNLRLSEERAEAVLGFIAAGGIDRTRLRATGQGEAQPIGDNDTSTGREQNRRIEIRLSGPPG